MDDKIDDLIQIKEKNLYICHTYYHVLIAIIKQIKSGICSDIMLSADFSNDLLVNDKLLINRLKESKMFCNILIFDYSKEEITKKENLFTFYRIYIGNRIIRKQEYNLFDYKKIYIFWEYSLIGYVLNKQRVEHHLLEEGIDCFKIKYKGRYKDKKSLKKLIKKFLKIYYVGESPYIKTIEVNNKENLYIKHSNIVECPKKDLFLSLSSKQKNEILKIFLERPDVLLDMSDCVLILTQPLFEDKICSTEEEKVNIYKEIIKQYASNENVIIKTHPREITDYDKYVKDYKNVKIINERFPIEILNFLDVRFKKVITIFSTSINIIENCDEKIELGYEYIKDKMEKK